MKVCICEPREEHQRAGGGRGKELDEMLRGPDLCSLLLVTSVFEERQVALPACPAESSSSSHLLRRSGRRGCCFSKSQNPQEPLKMSHAHCPPCA